MSETTFTSGPWNVVTFSDGVLVSTPSTCVAEVMRSELEPHRIPTKANAALIAAAPDLYAALNSLLSAVRSIEYAAGWETDHLEESRMAEAALAKARGET